jgi:hypothetical protein
MGKSHAHQIETVMTRDDLIAALADDQEITRTKAEDILQALTDLCAETLAKGEPFNLGFGFLAVRPSVPALRGDLRGMLIFQGTEKFRERIGLSGRQRKLRDLSICKRCGVEPARVHLYDECGGCLSANGRKKPQVATRSYNQRSATK